MGGRNRVVGGRKFLEHGAAMRGHVNVLSQLAVDLTGDTGATGATGAAGADGTQVVTALEAGFNPALYAAGTVVFLVDNIATPTDCKFGGKKGDGGGGNFPSPIEIA